ncbi:MAG: hypothetical protein WAN74_04405 [Thermoplasmata archaeon]
MTAERGARRFFPTPLVGVAAILLVLIVLTPVLIGTGVPAAGTIFTQAEVIVDYPGSNSTSYFYLHAIGNVRYANLSIGVAENYDWNTPPPIGSIVWGNWTNGTNMVVIGASYSNNPIAVNVSAYYTTAKEGSAWYVAILAFEVSGNTLFMRSYTAGVDVPHSIQLTGSQQPVAILLSDIGATR